MLHLTGMPSIGQDWCQQIRLWKNFESWSSEFKKKVFKKFKISFVHLSKASSWDNLKLLDSNFLSFFAPGFWTWSHPVDMKWSMIKRQPSRRQSSIYKVELYRNLLGYILRLSYSSSKKYWPIILEKLRIVKIWILIILLTYIYLNSFQNRRISSKIHPTSWRVST